MDPEDVRCSSYPMCGIITSWNAAEKWDLFEFSVLINCGTWWYPRWRIPQFILPQQTSDSWLVDIGWFFVFSHLCLLFGIDNHARCLHTLLQPLPSTLFHPDATLQGHSQTGTWLARALNNPTGEGGVLGLVGSGQSLQSVLVASWSCTWIYCVSSSFFFAGQHRHGWNEAFHFSHHQPIEVGWSCGMGRPSVSLCGRLIWAILRLDIYIYI